MDTAAATDPSKLPGLIADVNKQLADVKDKVILFNSTQTTVDKALADIKLK